MSDGFRVQGDAGVVAEVSANKELYVASPVSGMQTTNLYGETYEVGNNGRVRQSPENHVIHDLFSGSALNTNIWTTSVSGMTVSVGSGVCTLNAGSSVTANNYAILQSILQPAYLCDFGSYFHFRTKITWASNTTIEFGYGNCATNAAPTDGFFFRITASGALYVVMSFGGTETVFQAPSYTIDPTKAYEFQMEVFNDHIKWYVALSDNTTIFTDGGSALTSAPLFIPNTQIKPVLLSTDQHMPVFARVAIGSSTAGAAPQLILGHANFIQRDISRLKSWAEVSVGAGRGIYQGPGSSSLVQTANHANSTSPVSATLSNTAAGYTTLGGRWQFVAPAGAVTDFVLFGFQVPANFQFYITSVAISAINTGAAVATNPTVLDWALAVNSSTVSLATADTPPTSWAPRRIPLGLQTFLVGAAIGAQAIDLVRNFPTPVVCDGSRFIQGIVQVPIGTATASQVIRGDFMINGYAE